MLHVNHEIVDDIGLVIRLRHSLKSIFWEFVSTTLKILFYAVVTQDAKALVYIAIFHTYHAATSKVFIEQLCQIWVVVIAILNSLNANLQAQKEYVIIQ